jgi:hypothetical protein
MPQYTLFISNKHSRVRYPRSFDLPDVEAARQAALRLVRVFAEVVPYWNDLSASQQSNFMVEVLNEDGETVLTVPFTDGPEV